MMLGTGRRKWQPGVIAVVIGGLGLAACSGTKEASKTPSSATWAIAFSVNSLDPGLTYDSAGNNEVTFSICDPLMRYGPDLKLQPAIAKSVTQTSPTTYQFTLNPAAKFWNGDPVTADDVAFSLNRIVDPKLASPILSLVQGADFKDAVVTGNDTVVLETSKPNPIAQWLAATPAGQVVEKKVVEQYGSSFGTAADKVMCSGPYKPVSYTKGNSTVIEATPGYWDTTNMPKIKKVTFLEVPNSADTVAGLRSGEIDGTFDITARDARTLDGQPDLNVYVGPGSNINYLAPNLLKGPFANLDVRKALSMALDRKGVATAIDGKDGQPATGPLIPGLVTYEKDMFAQAAAKSQISDSPQLDQAKALMAQSGFSGATVKIIVLSGTIADTTAAALQSAGNSIGLHVDIIKATSSEFYAEAFSGKYPRKYDALSIFFAPDIPDPAGLLVPPYASKFANQQGWKSAQYDQLRDAWSTSKNGSAQQAQALINMENLIIDQQVNIPTNITPLVMVTRKDLAGYKPTNLYYYQPFMVSMGASQ